MEVREEKAKRWAAGGVCEIGIGTRGGSRTGAEAAPTMAALIGLALLLLRWAREAA